MIDIGARLAALQNEIQVARRKNETQSAPPKLIAVSKKQPLANISAAIEAGQKSFAENYWQDALPKIEHFSARELEWHFIGPIQRNKCGGIAEHFSWVHSVDKLAIAERLDRLAAQRRAPERDALKVLLQVNIDRDENKAGVAPEHLSSLAAEVAKLPHLHLRGLMTILRPNTGAASQYKSFVAMRELRDELQAQLGDLHKFNQLSMGMSADWHQALRAGATMLRIGTAIFGERGS